MHSKFCVLILCVKSFAEYENWTTKGAWLMSRDQFRNFGTPFTSLERFKLETAYLVHHVLAIVLDYP